MKKLFLLMLVLASNTALYSVTEARYKEILKAEWQGLGLKAADITKRVDKLVTKAKTSPNALDSDGLSDLARVFQYLPEHAIKQAEFLLQNGATLIPLVSKALLVQKGLHGDYYATAESVFSELDADIYRFWRYRSNTPEARAEFKRLKTLIKWYLAKVIAKHPQYATHPDYKYLFGRLGETRQQLLRTLGIKDESQSIATSSGH